MDYDVDVPNEFIILAMIIKIYRNPVNVSAAEYIIETFSKHITSEAVERDRKESSHLDSVRKFKRLFNTNTSCFLCKCNLSSEYR